MSETTIGCTRFSVDVASRDTTGFDTGSGGDGHVRYPVFRFDSQVSGELLSVYLATRIVELVVHTDDLAASLDVATPKIPATATDVAVATLLELARARSGDLALIHAFARAERADLERLRVL